MLGVLLVLLIFFVSQLSECTESKNYTVVNVDTYLPNDLKRISRDFRLLVDDIINILHIVSPTPDLDHIDNTDLHLIDRLVIKYRSDIEPRLKLLCALVDTCVENGLFKDTLSSLLPPVMLYISKWLPTASIALQTKIFYPEIPESSPWFSRLQIILKGNHMSLTLIDNILMGLATIVRAEAQRIQVTATIFSRVDAMYRQFLHQCGVDSPSILGLLKRLVMRSIGQTIALLNNLETWQLLACYITDAQVQILQDWFEDTYEQYVHIIRAFLLGESQDNKWHILNQKSNQFIREFVQMIRQDSIDRGLVHIGALGFLHIRSDKIIWIQETFEREAAGLISTLHGFDMIIKTHPIAQAALNFIINFYRVSTEVWQLVPREHVILGMVPLQIFYVRIIRNLLEMSMYEQQLLKHVFLVKNKTFESMFIDLASEFLSKDLGVKDLKEGLGLDQLMQKMRNHFEEFGFEVKVTQNVDFSQILKGEDGALENFIEIMKTKLEGIIAGALPAKFQYFATLMLNNMLQLIKFVWNKDRERVKIALEDLLQQKDSKKVDSKLLFVWQPIARKSIKAMLTEERLIAIETEPFDPNQAPAPSTPSMYLHETIFYTNNPKVVKVLKTESKTEKKVLINDVNDDQPPTKTSRKIFNEPDFAILVEDLQPIEEDLKEPEKKTDGKTKRILFIVLAGAILLLMALLGLALVVGRSGGSKKRTRANVSGSSQWHTSCSHSRAMV